MSTPEKLDPSILNCVRPMEQDSSILNCVRPIERAKPAQARRPVVRKPAPVSIAVCAVVAYLLIALTTSYFYFKMCNRAADELPSKLDVLVAGSSVISLPLMAYEYPKVNPTLLVDRFPIIETPKFQGMLSSIGAPVLSVYNSATVGQHIEETEEFVQGFLSLNKRPRLLILFVAPVSMVGGHSPAPRGCLPYEVESILLKSDRDFDDFRSKAQRQGKHFLTAFYSKVNIRETKSGFWGRVQADYKRYYTHKFSVRRLEAFANILKLCRSHSIKTLVVSTPLTASNRAMMAEPSYDQYVRKVREIVRNSQGDESPEDGDFIDFGQSPEFVDSLDFKDPAHCNASGGEKMLTSIAPTVVKILNSKGH